MTVQEFIDSLNPSNSLGYATIYITADNAVLSWEAAEEMQDRIIEAITARINGDKANEDDQWDVVACRGYQEGPPLTCAHTGNPIESDCGDPDEEKETGDMQLLVGSGFGIYIPQAFVENYGHDIINREELKKDLATIAAGPNSSDNYVEVWHDIVDDIRITIDGTIYYLYENEGDLWAVEEGTQPVWE